MRLAEFISTNIEEILLEWEDFAGSIWPGETTDPTTLRDDAEEILQTTVADMKSDQTSAEQSDISKGKGGTSVASKDVNATATKHGRGRLSSRFDLAAVMAEYRALRASVLRLWSESDPKPNLRDLDDITRFNESMDQSLAQAVRSYARQVEHDRESLLADELAARVEAEAANRAKDVFLATLSHEMRTPLSAIVGWITILRMKDCSAEDLQEGLEAVDRNTKVQVKLIEDVLDVSRIVSGKLQLDIRSCELTDIISAGIDVLRPAAEAREITLDVWLDPSASRTMCDANRIQQVVWNLVSNAIKFTPKGGAIRVTLTPQDTHLQIQVSDTGVGLGPEILPYVFDRFRQADSGTRRKFGGLGLGLSIVKHLVDAHGGSVTAQSAGLGLGSTFTVRLPLKPVRGDVEPTNAERNTKDEADSTDPFPLVRLDGVRVLIVDDVPDARRLMVKVLGLAGAIVTVADSAAEAMEAIRNEKPDVLVSDIGMPEQDGYDLIRAVRAARYHARDLPAIALTAFVHKNDARQALLAGYQMHLPKPTDMHDLTAVIASLTGRTS